MDAFLSMIAMFGCNFAPRGWQFCNGQILSIAQNSALFALLGTTFGGNGQTTFGLPDLRGRAPIQFGQGNGLTPRTLGEMSGFESTTLNVTQMPAHTHGITASASLHGENASGTLRNPAGNMLAGTSASATIYAAPNPADNHTMAAESIVVTATAAQTGGNQPLPIVQPFLAVNFCICVSGIFPSRN